MATTLLDLRDRVKRELDLEEDSFITDSEMNTYINDSIRECEADIHNLYEDYFFTSSYLALVDGTSTYSLPSDIYAKKIRGIFYDDGTTNYEVLPIKKQEEMIDVDTNADYKYKIFNDSTNGFQLNLFPASRETSTDHVKIFYLRNAKALSSDTDILDIPEFENFIISSIKVRCYNKEGDPRYQGAINDKAFYRQQMKDTLSHSSPDENNTLIQDLEIYYEHN